MSPEIIARGILEARSNKALSANQPVANNNITTHGSDWLWAVCALHGLLLLGVIVWTYMTNPRRRVFHYFAISILFIATIYYFIMASDLGGRGVPVEFRQGNIAGRTRQVFYARWVGYFLNFNIIWLALLLMSGAGWASILYTLLLNSIWAVMLLIGMFVRSSYKWGFYLFALLSYFLLAWQTMGVVRRYTARLDAPTHRAFTALAAYTLFFQLIYPIAWGVSEGGNRITNDGEAVFYGILDIFSQGLFSLFLLFMARRLDFDFLRLGFADHGRVRENVDYHDEKRMHAGGASNGHGAVDGHHNGVTPATGTTTTAPAV